MASFIEDVLHLNFGELNAQLATFTILDFISLL